MNTVGLYIHIPFCVRKCLYCDFCSFEGQLQHADAYIDALLREAALRAGACRDRVFDTVFFGGGTPSLLSGVQLKRLMHGLQEIFFIAEDAEISIEANPGTVNAEKLRAYREIGINRLSLGVQAAQDTLLEKLGRIHRFADARQALRDAKAAGFSRINLDFMTGLPGQRPDDLRRSLAWAVSEGVGHISLYSLIVEEGTPFFERYEAGELPLPDEDTERSIFEEACQFLERSGLSRYEISNFARAGEECRHNIRYWKRQDYLGLGVAAVTQEGAIRRKNPEMLQAYMNPLAEGLLPQAEIEEISLPDLRFETVMLALRMTQGLNFADFQKQFGTRACDLARRFSHRWAQAGFAVPDTTHLRLTPAGFDVQNSLLVEFWEALDAL